MLEPGPDREDDDGELERRRAWLAGFVRDGAGELLPPVSDAVVTSSGGQARRQTLYRRIDKSAAEL